MNLHFNAKSSPESGQIKLFEILKLFNKTVSETVVSDSADDEL